MVGGDEDTVAWKREDAGRNVRAARFVGLSKGRRCASENIGWFSPARRNDSA
jgi:hypothetical protein